MFLQYILGWSLTSVLNTLKAMNYGLKVAFNDVELRLNIVLSQFCTNLSCGAKF